MFPVRDAGEGGMGGNPLYKLYRYVRCQRVWFLSHFGLKEVIDLTYCDSDMIFQFFC